MSSEAEGRSSYRAVIGGWVCFILGTVMMFWDFYAKLIHGPLFLASIVLGIVAVTKRQLFSGLMLICLSLLIPSFLNYAGPGILDNHSRAHTPSEEDAIYPSIRESTGSSAIADNSSQKANIQALNAYQLSFKEKNVLMNLIYQDLMAQINGREHSVSLTIPLPLIVSSENLMSDYGQNEVRADQRYRDKKLIVNGIATSINRGLGRNYYITLSSDNMFMGPRANMADGYEGYLAGLKKGDSLSLFCKGSGMLLGSPVLDECIPGELLAEEKATYLYDDLIRKFTNRERLATGLVAIAIAVMSILPETSSCFKNYGPQNIDCFQELSGMNHGNENFKEAWKSTASKFGVKLNINDPQKYSSGSDVTTNQ